VPEMKRFNNILELMQVFSSEDVCREHLKKLRWADGEYCPYCGCKKIYEFKDGKTYKCADCRKRFSIKVGTIFEDSKIPLQKWFIAIYLITSHKKGISSVQLSKDIGVTQKTAWFMLHRLRHASKTKAFNRPLKNVVEADETYIGGKEKYKHNNKKVKGTQGRNTKTKTPVIGVVERQGHVKACKVDNVRGQTVKSYIIDNVVIGSKLMTDEYRAYRGMEYLFEHRYISHSKGQYVNKCVHTNTIENFWSLLKRGIVGIYHFVSVKHLDRYLDEFTFRYNSKKETEEDRFNFLLSNCNGRLKYCQLIEAI
jgi:transposase-like protein